MNCHKYFMEVPEAFIVLSPFFLSRFYTILLIMNKQWLLNVKRVLELDKKRLWLSFFNNYFSNIDRLILF